MVYPIRILLTGGTGFFGRAILRNLKERATKQQFLQDKRVTILSRDPTSFIARFPEFQELSWLSFRIGDICNPLSLTRAESFTHILHAATDSTVGPQLTPLMRFQQIIDGTRHLLEFAVACGARRFLLTSSGGIYGPQPLEVAALPEDWLGSPSLRHPANAYSLGKRAAEHLCALYQDAYGIETVIARCFTFVGRDLPLDVHFAIGNFIRNALESDVIEVTGDGSPLRSYLDQDDLAHWLLTMLEHGRSGEAYNLGSDEVISIADLAYLVRDLLAPEKPVRFLGQRTDAHGRNRYIPDIRKAQRELGLRVTIPLTKAIKRAGTAHRRILTA